MLKIYKTVASLVSSQKLKQQQKKNKKNKQINKKETKEIQTNNSKEQTNLNK